MSVFTNSASSSIQQAEAYTEAVLGLVGNADPIDVLGATTDVLRRAIDGMSVEQMSRPEAPGKWSVRQVLRHLADSEIVWSYRMRMVLAHDRPALGGYDQDAWAERLGYADANAEDSITDFEVLRRANLRLLAVLRPEDLKRVGVHAERGEESIEHLMRLYAGHDLLHLRQLARIRAAVS